MEKLKTASRSKAVYCGLVCDSCQENINHDRCLMCGEKFQEDDIIYCVNHSQMDCEHCCEKCYIEKK